jgi:hypothetical protein
LKFIIFASSLFTQFLQQFFGIVTTTTTTTTTTTATTHAAAHAVTTRIGRCKEFVANALIDLIVGIRIVHKFELWIVGIRIRVIPLSFFIGIANFIIIVVIIVIIVIIVFIVIVFIFVVIIIIKHIFRCTLETRGATTTAHSPLRSQEARRQRVCCR